MKMFSGVLSASSVLILATSASYATLVNDANDPWGVNDGGSIELLVDTTTGHAYLQFSGYNSNSTMGFGMFAVTSASKSLQYKNYSSIGDVIASISGYAGFTDPIDPISGKEIDGGVNCCCQFYGYGVTVAELVQTGALTLNASGYYQYDLGAVYGGTADLVFYYTNLAAMVSIVGESSVVSYGWGGDMSGDGYQIPVHTSSVIYYSSSIPEPASAGFLAVAAVALLKRRRQR